MEKEPSEADDDVEIHYDISEQETQLLQALSPEDEIEDDEDEDEATYVEGSLVKVEMHEVDAESSDFRQNDELDSTYSTDGNIGYDEKPSLVLIDDDRSQCDEEEDEDIPENDNERLLRIHETTQNLTNNTSPSKSGNFGFTCDLCNETFQNQFSFFEHLRTHYDQSSSKAPEPFQLEPTTKPVEVPISSSMLREKLKLLKARRQSSIQEVSLLPFKNSTDVDPGTSLDYHDDEDEDNSGKPKSLILVQDGGVDYTMEYEPDEESEIVDDCNDLKEEIDSEEANEFEVEEDDMLDETYKETNGRQLRRLRRSARKKQQQEILCPDCGEFFESLTKLKTHKKTVHDEAVITRKPPIPLSRSERLRIRVSSLKCKECSKVFNHKNSLVYHMKGHANERNYECTDCGKKFLTSSALNVHMRLHTGEKPYHCQHCSKPFRQWGDLAYHMVSLHSNVRAYVCEFCGKDFARKYSLTVHRRIHTLERDYTCEYCSKSFRAASYLQSHRRIHTGEKPHNCDVCGKPFRVKSDMKRHRLSHNRHEPKARARKVRPVPRTSQPSANNMRLPLTRSKASSNIQEPNAKGKRLEPAENGVIVHNLVAVDESGQIIELEPQIAEQLRAGQVIQVPLPVSAHRTSRRITIENADGSTITGDLDPPEDDDEMKEEEQEVSVEYLQHAPVLTTDGINPPQGSLYVWPAFMVNE